MCPSLHSGDSPLCHGLLPQLLTGQYLAKRAMKLLSNSEDSGVLLWGLIVRLSKLTHNLQEGKSMDLEIL